MCEVTLSPAHHMDSTKAIFPKEKLKNKRQRQTTLSAKILTSLLFIRKAPLQDPRPEHTLALDPHWCFSWGCNGGQEGAWSALEIKEQKRTHCCRVLSRQREVCSKLGRKMT